jgi:hypothetical protein
MAAPSLAPLVGFSSESDSDMTRALIAVAVLAILWTPRLHAQAPAQPPKNPGAGLPQVYKPEQLGPVQKQARDAVSTLRDSVAAAGGALAGLGADAQTASLQVLESRAATVVDRCAAAERQRAHSVTQLSEAPLAEPGEIKAQKEMLKQMDKLKKPLDQCLATYQPMSQRGKGQEVRDYGPSRAKPIIAGFQQFDQSLKPFATAMKIQFRPILSNAGPSPLD